MKRPEIPGRLDETMHPATRLSICGLLAAGADWVEFAVVRDSVAISDSTMSKHSRALEDAGYIEVRKGAVGRRPRTWFRLTHTGRAALDKHLIWLHHAAAGDASLAWPDDVRASNADRARVTEQLAEQTQAGRLSSEERDERTAQAQTALTLGDLRALIDDLPISVTPPIGPSNPTSKTE